MINSATRTLGNFKMFATWGFMLGLVLVIIGTFVSDYIGTYAISAAGIGVNIASMVVFGFGMCMSLMEEYNEKTY